MVPLYIVDYVSKSKELLGRLIFVLFIFVFSYYIGKGTVVDPRNIRTFLGGALILLLASVSIKRPNTAMYLITIYLPLMGIIRRILIPFAGWSSFDPLVILSSIISLLMGSYWFYTLFFVNNKIENDSIVFRAVRWMILIDFLEVLNPHQGSVLVGLGGILFYIVPLFWMVASRSYITEIWVQRIIHTVFILGIMVALYGLKQTMYGFYPFEQQWLAIAGLTALHVGGQIRAVSTLDNPQEYAAYLQISLVVAWVYVLRGGFFKKMVGLLGGIVISYALFLESVRASLISTVLAIGVLAVLNAKTRSNRIVLGIVIVVISTVGINLLSHLQPAINNSNLVNHSIGGFTQPFNSKTSSLSGHISEMLSGIWRGIRSVVGYGLGATTTAAGKFAASNSGTELDVSNMFVSNGVLGGVTYIVLIVTLFTRALGIANMRSIYGLVLLGILICTFGQWINGELYSSTTILWILVGFLDKSSEFGQPPNGI